MRITLNGQVVSDDNKWLYDYFEVQAFSPREIRDAIRENPEGEDLVLEINSQGGSVFAGFEIFTLLRGAEIPTVAEVQSLAASAASTVMSGCDRVFVSPVAQVMLHQPTVGTWGNIDDHDKSLRMLESIQRSIVNGYAARCGGKTTRRHLENLVNKESWLTAQEAVEIGLADGILGEESGVIEGGAVSVAGGEGRSLVTNGTGLHDPDELLARYEEAVLAGATPVAGHPVRLTEAKHEPFSGEEPDDSMKTWRRRARLAIEQNRF